MKNQKGITLIALVITIIVMLILVGVSVTVALNGGLFSTANQAVSKTQLELDKEQLLMAAIGAIGNDGKVKTEKLELPEGFTVSNGVYTSKSGNKFTISESGNVTLVPEGGTAAKVWTQDGTTVTDGTTPLDVGATVSNYNAGNKTWQILGAEGGKLLLTTSTTVGNGKNLVASTEDWDDTEERFVGLEEELDSECATLIGNKGVAETIRSITEEDINRVTGYDPTKDTSLNWYGGDPITVATGVLPNGNNSIELTSTFYSYADNATPNYVDNSPAYLMIFGTSSNQHSYWLASTAIFAPESATLNISLRVINGCRLDDTGLLAPNSSLWGNTLATGINTTGITNSVRPVAVMPASFVPTIASAS